MSNYLEYLEDGQVVATMNDCPIFPDAHYGGTVVEVEARFETPGQLLYLDEEVIDLGPTPSPHHERDPGARTWRLAGTFNELDLARDAAWVAIKRERDRREMLDLETPYGVFQVNAKGRKNIESSVQMLRAKQEVGLEATIKFTLEDDSRVTLTYEQMREVGLLLGQQIDEVHQTSRALYDLIYASDDPASITWPEA